MPRAQKSQTQEPAPKLPDYGPNSAQPRKASPKAEWMSFVPCELKETQKPDFVRWFQTSERTVQDSLSDALGEGLKFALTYDVRNQCIVASLSGRPSPARDYDWNATLTGRGGTISEAMAVVFYKHLVILEGDWFECLNNKPSGNFSFG